MFALVSRNEASAGRDHTPPGQAVAGGQDPPDRPGRAGVSGLFCDLPVGGEVAGLEAVEGGPHPPFELAHRPRGRFHRAIKPRPALGAAATAAIRGWAAPGESSACGTFPCMSDASYLADGDQFVATEWTRGPWTADAQHAGPPAAGGAARQAGPVRRRAAGRRRPGDRECHGLADQAFRDPGPAAAALMRARVPLVEGEDISPLSRVLVVAPGRAAAGREGPATIPDPPR
jgi:hypothetical protein